MAMGARPPCDSGMRLSKACIEDSPEEGQEEDDDDDDEAVVDDDDDDVDDDEEEDDEGAVDVDEESATAPAMCLKTAGASKYGCMFVSHCNRRT